MDSDPVFPKCAVCNTSFRYRGQQPHLLPCLHPVCEDCLKSPEVTTLDCAVCLKSHDVGSFPVDDVVLGDVLNQTMKHRPSDFQCTNKVDGNQAMSWCLECEEYFCEHCHISHSEVKATRNHTMKYISDLPCTWKRSQSVCEKHGHRLNVYDKDCDCFICLECCYEDHASHGTERADMFLNHEQDVVKAYLKSTLEKKEKIISTSETVLSQARRIEDKAVSLRDTVQHTFSELRDVIDQREKEVLVELDQILDSMRNINDSRRPVLESLKTSCKTVLDYINKTLLYASPSHLHKLKSSITQAFESCIKAEIPVVHKYEPSVVFSRQGLLDLKSLVASFGGFMTSLTQTESPPEASLKTGLQMKLEADIDELQTQNRNAQMLISALETEASQNEQKVKTLQKDVSRLQGIVIQLHPKGSDSDTWLHVLGTVDRARHVIICPTMMFDSERVNLYKHINDKGLLTNTKPPKWLRRRAVDSSGKMLKNYGGTCSTSPLPSSGLVYWEVEADVELDKPLGNGQLVLEVGVCGEDVMDSKRYISGQSNSCSLYISCDENDVIRYITINEKFAATAKVFENKAGRYVRVKYGVLVDTDKMAVVFLDTDSKKVLGSGCIVDKKPQHGAGYNREMWPVFAVYSSPKRVEMKLVSGSDVQMDARKRKLLEDASRICENQHSHSSRTQLR